MTGKPISYVLPRKETLPALEQLKAAGLAEFYPHQGSGMRKRTIVKNGWQAQSNPHAQVLLEEVLKKVGLTDLRTLHSWLLRNAEQINRKLNYNENQGKRPLALA
jgi:hypothetical protein